MIFTTCTVIMISFVFVILFIQSVHMIRGEYYFSNNQFIVAILFGIMIDFLIPSNYKYLYILTIITICAPTFTYLVTAIVIFVITCFKRIINTLF